MKKEWIFHKKIISVLLQIFLTGFLLPLFLFVWSFFAGGSLFGESFFAKRILGNFLFTLPDTVFYRSGIFAFILIITGTWAKERSEKMRFALYAGFILLMTTIFLQYSVPFGVGAALPVLVLGCIALYTSHKKNPRKKLFPNKRSLASLPERASALLFLAMIVIAAMFVFQEGAEYLLLSKWGACLLFLPLAGCLLPSGKRVRDHLFAAFTGFIFLSAVFCFFTAFLEAIWFMDLSIIFIFIFWEYQMLLLLRGILPEIKNLSLIFLAVLFFVNGKILPEVCDVNIVTLSIFILYIVGDNWERMIKKIRRRLDPEKNLLAKPPKEGFAVQAWCIGAFTLISLTGKKGVLPFFFLSILLFLTAILKELLLFRKEQKPVGEQKMPEWKKAREYLPLLPECGVILGFSFVQVFLWEKGFLASVICAGCLALCVWNLGIVITGRDARKLPVHASLYHAASCGGIFLFMLLLFFYGVSSSVAASLGLLLCGIALLGEGAYVRIAHGEENRGFLLRKWIARITLAAGFAVIVLPSEPLRTSFGELSAVACGALAFFAVNVYYIVKNKLKKYEVSHGGK